MSNTTSSLGKDNTMIDVQLDEPMSNLPNKHSNRRSLLLLLAVFILPIVLAKMALDNQWLALGVTNKGTLLTNPLTLNELGIKTQVPDKKWLVIYKLPLQCNSSCLASVEAVHNSYIAIGKDRPRVAAILLNAESFSAEALEQLSRSQWLSVKPVDMLPNQTLQAQVLIADPLGNIMLVHQVPDDTEKLPQFGKAILADMKKLLKYSKVG